MEAIHKTVLLEEAVDALNVKPNGVYVDATFGFGGHTREVLKKINNEGRVIGIEADREIYNNAKSVFKSNKNLSLYHSNFVDVVGIVVSHGFSQVDGIIFDLGLNLYQIRESGRGFSFLKNETLDMRIDKETDLTAEEVINSYSREQLEGILKNVNERFARVIAKRITEARRKKRIRTTDDLVEVVKSVKYQKGRIHPATLTFMALRIEVNNEMGVLEKALENSTGILKDGGRLVVITFHSGEDRIAKRFMREQVTKGDLRIVNKKVIIPGREEQIRNPMSRSAKMRVAERVISA